MFRINFASLRFRWARGSTSRFNLTRQGFRSWQFPQPPPPPLLPPLPRRLFSLLLAIHALAVPVSVHGSLQRKDGKELLFLHAECFGFPWHSLYAAVVPCVKHSILKAEGSTSSPRFLFCAYTRSSAPKYIVQKTVLRLLCSSLRCNIVGRFCLHCSQRRRDSLSPAHTRRTNKSPRNTWRTAVSDRSMIWSLSCARPAAVPGGEGTSPPQQLPDVIYFDAIYSN